MISLFGISIVLLQKTLQSVANIYECYFSRSVFNSVWSYAVLNSLIYFPLLIILALSFTLETISIINLALIVLISAIELLYQIPYYESLKKLDPSIVSSIFSLGKIIIPIMAFYVTNERLSIHQTLGVFLILFSSVLVNISKSGKFKARKTFLVMVIVSIITSIQSVLLKYEVETVNIYTFYFWFAFVQVALSLVIYIINRDCRIEIVNFLSKLNLRDKRFFLIQNLITIFCFYLSLLSLKILPVSIVKSISTSQSLIVHCLSSMSNKLGVVQYEIISYRRITLLTIIGIGVILIIQ